MVAIAWGDVPQLMVDRSSLSATSLCRYRLFLCSSGSTRGTGGMLERRCFRTYCKYHGEITLKKTREYNKMDNKKREHYEKAISVHKKEDMV
jgi:hypothetical protein